MMPTILVAGAGKSSTSLIQYLISNANKYKWQVVVADGSIDAIKDKIGDNKSVKSVQLDIHNVSARQQLVMEADLVVSILPPDLHIHLAKDCLQFKKNLITSSYISPEMKAMDDAVKEAGLMFMCEMGLDPGIDHMTANQIIHSIQRVASELVSFKSYCGGLIAPESDDNPWHYKFSWNPKNVVIAGRGGATFLQNGKEVFVDYEHLFHHNKKIQVEGIGALAYYPNRDSLKYLDTYEVPDAKTFIRATLRHPDFCKGWDAMIQLGLTDLDDDNSQCSTNLQWVSSKTNFNGTGSIVHHVAHLLQLDPESKVMHQLAWLGLFDEIPIQNGLKTSADILLEILQHKWVMKPHDKDMVVMQHEVEYIHKGSLVHLISSMTVIGEDAKHSAMAKTVGLPMAILAKLVITGKINLPHGVCIPNMPSVYRPVLNELKHFGISFEEQVN